MNAPLTKDAMIEAQARDWLLRLNAGEATDEALAAWRAQDESHDRAFRDAQLAWSALGRTRFAREDDWRAPARPRWAVPVAIAASLAVAVVVTPQLLNGPARHLRTNVAETQQVTLADGTKVFVGAKSAVDLRMADDSRTAVLKGGEAFFEVAADPSRPFTVVAGDAVIRVKGTKFNVCRTPYGVRVAVLEGKVEVLQKRFLSTPAKPDRVIVSGEQVRLASGEGLSAPSPVNAEPGGWRQGRMQYADAPLKEVVADANRYSDRPIRLASNDIGDLRVTVSFRTKAVDELIANLDAGLPVAAAEDGGDIVLKAER